MELANLISSRPTDLSIPHRGLRYLYEQLQQNKFSPKFLVNNLEYALEDWQNEFRFFKVNKIEIDSIILENYYNQHGFHKFKCNIKFYGDKKTHLNILEFIINAGPRWKFGPIIYLGLDSLPADVKRKIEKTRKLKKGMPFDEVKLFNEMKRINSILLESGYFYTKVNYNYPVQIDMENKENSVVVLFEPGIRQKIESIEFVDSLTTQTPISLHMKESLLDFKVGEYYNPKKILQSELNLYSLGTFSLVTIDTVDSHSGSSDSTLKLRAQLNYRKQHDYHVGIFFNQTTWDQAYNIGVEGNYSNKNLLGAAQLFNPFVKFTLLDISRVIQNWPNYEYELAAGINFSQPMLWNFPGFKVGFSTQPLYSYRIFNKFLELETWSLPFTFNVNLPIFTFFQNMNIKFTFERQDPKNFEEAMNKLYGELDGGTNRDTVALLETFTLYDNLDTYVRNHHPILTANLIGGALTGDKRDNPFAPTKGYFANFSIEGLNPIFLPFEKLEGAAKFIRLQVMYLYFKSISPFSTLAFKIKTGYIFWWDKFESYVPPDKQFFAGGANSVRGWSSRRLRYYRPEQFDFDFGGSDVSQDYALDYVGNSTVIEGSFEYRFRFSKTKSIGNLFSEQLSNFGFVAFLDFGNAFQWLVIDTTGNYYFTYRWEDFFTKLAYAAGVGLRYETPVGPIRIDFGWPVYDPMRKKDPFIFTRYKGFKSMVFHIGLGHAF
jgi:outer membrane protein assembly factor BamA